jgi:hypothetical protein
MFPGVRLRVRVMVTVKVGIVQYSYTVKVGIVQYSEGLRHMVQNKVQDKKT